MYYNLPPDPAHGPFCTHPSDKEAGPSELPDNYNEMREYGWTGQSDISQGTRTWYYFRNIINLSNTGPAPFKREFCDKDGKHLFPDQHNPDRPRLDKKVTEDNQINDLPDFGTGFGTLGREFIDDDEPEAQEIVSPEQTIAVAPPRKAKKEVLC